MVGSEGSTWESEATWESATYGEGGAPAGSPGSETLPMGGTTVPGGYGITYPADIWMGWEAEIAAHSAGMEQYTASSVPGQPGVTSLTAAGIAALGLDPTKTYIQTLSWFPDLESVLKPLPPSSVVMFGIDFTPLANAILGPIRDALGPIITTLQDLMVTVGMQTTKILTPLTNVIISALDAVIKSSEKTGAGLGYLLDTSNTNLKKSIDVGLKDLEDLWQKAWTQALADINEVLRLARQIDDGIGDIVINTEELAGNMTKRFDKLDGSLQQWVPDAILGALLRALDAAVMRW